MHGIPRDGTIGTTSQLFVVFPIRTCFSVRGPSFLGVLCPSVFGGGVASLILIATVRYRTALVGQIVLIVFRGISITRDRVFCCFSHE